MRESMSWALCGVLTACTGSDSGDSGDSGDSAEPGGIHDAGDPDCHDVEGDGPWKRDLVSWRGDDGQDFSEVRLFQSCADVPSLAQNDDGALLAAFQGFVDPNQEAQWDKIAVRMSEDEGAYWGALQFITLAGAPTEAGRPFDPTATFDAEKDQWRMYFSMHPLGLSTLDENVCTYSATSDNGVDYTLEAGERFCVDGLAVIDPTVARKDGTWFYSAPSGAPQDGAYFATSNNGLDFTPQSLTPSDENHNWTGTLVAMASELRFYGTEVNIAQGNRHFFASTTDEGTTWSDFIQTNIPAGKDPATLPLAGGGVADAGTH